MIYTDKTEDRSKKQEGRRTKDEGRKTNLLLPPSSLVPHPSFLLHLTSFFLALAYCLLPTAYCFAEDSPLKEPVKLIKQGDYQNAIQSLDAVIREYSGTIWEKRAIYLSGHAYYKAGLFDDALKLLSKAAGEYPQLSDYAEYNLAKIYSEKRDYKTAIDTLDLLLTKNPITRLKARARFERAKNIFLLKNLPPLSPLLTKEGNGVVTEIKDFISEFPSDEKIPEAYYILGQSLEGAGNKADACSVYQFLYYSFPLDSFADLASNRISEIKKDKTVQLPPPNKRLEIKRIEGLMNGKNYGRAVKELLEMLERWKNDPLREIGLFNLAVSYKYSGNDSKSIQILNRLIKGFPRSPRVPEALYMLSKIYWNKGDTKKGIQYNSLILSRYPRSVWAGRALYVNARIAEDEGKSDTALILYSQLLKFAGAGELAEESSWRIGWIYYQMGEYYKAIEGFKRCAESFPDSQYADNSLYWMGKSAENVGNTEIAISAYQRLTADYQYTYYGQKGYEKFAALSPEFNNQQSGIDYQLSAVSYQPSEVWEFDTEAKLHIEKAQELIEIGFPEDAKEEIKAVSLPAETNINGLFSLSHLYLKAEAYPDLLSALNRIIGRLKRSEQNKLPKDFWMLFYPLSYWEIVSRTASENNVDPLLILSVMRQESAFNRMSLSSANAHGLMQLIPKTGERIYRMIWGGEFKNELLFEPEINIAMGVRYLTELIQAYNPDTELNSGDSGSEQALVLALEAYNAGANPVSAWTEKFGSLPADEFIEKITYPETRGYVKKVLRNYRNYKRLYKMQNTEVRSMP
ncbi:MAG: tetratricopeptide repeat protein [Nitrospinae bacterium]|nr:tetratricopeptide repeat protein [Nitrospinota bacterium]